MSITLWPVLPVVAVAGPLLFSRYLRHARHRRYMERLEEALSFDVPRPWHRDVRHALRSADDWVIAEGPHLRTKSTSGVARELIPLAGEAANTAD